MEYAVSGGADKESLQTWADFTFRLTSVEAIRGSGEIHLKQQLIFSYALIAVASGAAQFILDHQQIELGAGSVNLCRPEQTFGILSSSGSLEMYIFYFDIFQLQQGEQSGYTLTKDAQPFLHSSKITVYPSDQLAPMCHDIYGMIQMQNQRVSFRSQIDFQELLYYIHTNSQVKPRDANSVLVHAKQYIEENYTLAITIEQLARAAEFSPKYFGDLFKKKYGKSVMEYVGELRMQQAKRLMAENDTRLRDIAHRVGYVDEFYFSRKFKKLIGTSPTLYMSSRRRKLVAYGSGLLGQLLPLNITPYAAKLHPKWTEYYYREYRNDIPVHISAYRDNKDWLANIELLQQVSVDLIIATEETQGEEKAALERMAPVYYLPDRNMDWRGQFLLLSDFLGESWQADQWLTAYDRKVQSGRENLHAQLNNESVVVIRMLGNKLYLHCNLGMANMLYRELDLQPAYQSDTEIYNLQVTPEELIALPADHLLMLIRQESETLGEWKKLQNDPQWQKIPAVQRHRVHHLTSDPWREHSAYAQLRMLEQALQLLSVHCP